jgi:drug/metabolite transporter (DMT)-like permease
MAATHPNDREFDCGTPIAGLAVPVMTDRGDAETGSLWLTLMPGLFVVLWSTGFIGAKLGLPYAEPLTFLTLRFAAAGLLLLVVTLAARAAWPKSWTETAHIAVAGLLLHGVYLGCVFAAIHHGVEAGVSALIVCLQPLLVAAAAGPLLGERVTRLQWLGLALGIAGVVLVVWRKLELGLGTPLGVALCVIGLFGITAATLYQKRFCSHMPLRSGTVIQFAAAAAASGLVALALESRVVVWSGAFVFALAWLVVVLSLGAFLLLYLLIRHGAAARVSSLFFMVPPCTALLAYPLFGERFGPVALAGMALVTLGVALVNLKGVNLKR